MQAYQIVQKARDIHRLSSWEIIQALCPNFIECHGDRLMADDAAIIGGVGLMDDQPLTIIGIQKGKTVKENIKRNFGSSGPAGYRKAQRLMRQAEKFQRPILTLINTAGAYCAPESEQNGIGEAIASSLLLMSELTVPTVAIILGEGGSGGAIALALADKVVMLENSIYSILSPEGFASILWKDAKLAPKAADMMRLTAPELLELGVIDDIIPETDDLLQNLITYIKESFRTLQQQPQSERLQKKYNKFRNF
ncbi:MAG: carboxyltransferase subunit alpha [Aerococcaceae bacterium]|nr:carboxyltransferase subunit alpha [Aerococcaceae bacterium]